MVENRYIDQKEKSVSMKEIIIHFSSLLGYLKTKTRLITLWLLFGALLGLFVSFWVKPKYKAVTTFVLENSKKSGLGDYAGVAAKIGLSMPAAGGGLFQDDNNIMGLIKSKAMVINTLFSSIEDNSGKPMLVDLYAKFNGYEDEWKKDKKLSKVKFTGQIGVDPIADSLIQVFSEEIIKNNLRVEKPDKDEDIIYLSTSFTDEHFSKFFNERLLANVVSFYTEIQTKKSMKNVDILQRQVDSVRLLLNFALSDVAYTKEENPNPNPVLQRLHVASQRKMVDVEMNKAILEELVKQLELSKINLRRETPLVQVIDHPILPLEKIKIGKLKAIIIGILSIGCCLIIFLSAKYYFKLLMDR